MPSGIMPIAIWSLQILPTSQKSQNTLPTSTFSPAIQSGCLERPYLLEFTPSVISHPNHFFFSFSLGLPSSPTSNRAFCQLRFFLRYQGHGGTVNWNERFEPFPRGNITPIFLPAKLEQIPHPGSTRSSRTAGHSLRIEIR